MASGGGGGEAAGRSGPGIAAGWAALVLRGVVGTIFLAHGIQKVAVLGWRGGVPNFRAWGIPLAEVAYPLTVSVETLGGMALILGIGVRPVAAVLMGVMAVALSLVHLPHGFFLPNGIEFVLLLAAASAALVLLGPGRWALAPRVPWFPAMARPRERSDPTWMR